MTNIVCAPTAQLLYQALLLCGSFLGLLSTAQAVTLSPTPPAINAQAYGLQDFHSGQTLMSKNLDRQVEPASLTKLMTAYLVFEALQQQRLQLTDKARISEKAWKMRGSRMYLEVGKEVTIENLLKGMIIQSGNDASVALAEYLAGSEVKFADMMNRKAVELGLTQTHYVNSTGMPDPQHYSTVADLLRLTRSLIERFPTQYQLYSEQSFTYNNITQYNRNLLLKRDKHVDGVKTGFTTAAGHCLIASAKHGAMRLISVVMNTSSEAMRASESQKILDYGFRFFETYRLYKAEVPLNTERVWQGKRDSVQLGLNTPLYVTIPKGQYEQLNAAVHLDKRIVAPVKLGEVHGRLKISLNNEELVERDLVALHAIEQGNSWQRFVDYLRLQFQ